MIYLTPHVMSYPYNKKMVVRPIEIAKKKIVKLIVSFSDKLQDDCIYVYFNTYRIFKIFNIFYEKTN